MTASSPVPPPFFGGEGGEGETLYLSRRMRLLSRRIPSEGRLDTSTNAWRTDRPHASDLCTYCLVSHEEVAMPDYPHVVGYAQGPESLYLHHCLHPHSVSAATSSSPDLSMSNVIPSPWAPAFPIVSARSWGGLLSKCIFLQPCM